MGGTAAVPTKSTLFTYEGLVSQVEDIQKQMKQMEKILDHQRQKKRATETNLQSRSFVFIDPYGNKTTQKCLDHESINKILRRYKKDYVPKYLQQWIKIGSIGENEISPLTDCKLKSTVSKYEHGHQFATYVEVVARIKTSKDKHLAKLLLNVQLTDNMGQIKMKIMQQQNYKDVDLELFVFNRNEKSFSKKLTESTLLKSDETILSSHLYQNHLFILITDTQTIKVNYQLCLSFLV